MLASHSHFLMSDVYQTACYKADDVLPGWMWGRQGQRGIASLWTTRPPESRRRTFMATFWERFRQRDTSGLGFKRSRHRTCLKRLVPDSDRRSSGSASRKTRTAM